MASNETIPETDAKKEAALKSRLKLVGSRFEKFQSNCVIGTALCPLPGHGDTTPSLSIGIGDKRDCIVVHCHAGCPTRDILEVVGLRFSDLYPDNQMVVATYDYRDEQGELLYQSVRYDPKKFLQRTPKPGGGWIYKVPADIRRVPYRLPELLAAKAEAKARGITPTVFIPEGEKDADRLWKLGLIATTNVGGAGKWRDEYSQYLEGCTIVILPDNDEPGRQHAQNVAASAQSHAVSVKTLELPGLPEKGDVSDWLDAGGTRQRLTNLAKSAPASSGRVNPTVGCEPDGSKPSETPQNTASGDDRSSSRPVEPSKIPVEPFPVEALPAPLQRFVQSIAKALPCPPDYPGAMLLPVLSAFIGRKRRLEVKAGSWEEYPTLWTVVVARSGDRKTPAFSHVCGPLRKKQQELRAEYAKAKDDYDNLSDEEKENAQRPRVQQIWTSDVTIESLKDVLANNPNGVIYPADEISSWARSLGQYKGGRGDDTQHWLSIWSGVSFTSNRVGREPIFVDNPFVSITGGTQPDCVGDLAEDGREDGKIARFLFSYPDPIPNHDWTEDTVVSASEYEAICNDLSALPPSATPITFSKAAKALWVEWVNKHRKESPADNLRPAWAKMEGYCARLALVLYLARQASKEADPGEQIDTASISGAIKLIAYFKSHAKRVYGWMADVSDKSRIGNALRWIKRHGGTATAKKAQQYGLTKTSDEAKQLFDDLAELGHGTVTKEARGSVVFRVRETSANS